MSNAVRYTAAKRRELAAAKAAESAATDAAHAAMTLEAYLEAAAGWDLAATVDPAGFVEFHTARHAALVAGQEA